ncbi:MAG: pyridoxamine 5'-phosphate oxidase family protein [Rhizobiaceae bacterium]|nr:pyridoxamine 5'-phosphate oxidase family protein [Rhizobiaceae bacterium]
MHIKTMSEVECLDFVQSHRLARLACSVDDRPYAVPIHYAFRNHFFYSFSMRGRKIDMMRKNPNVALLVEEFGSERGWKSVVAEGRFEELPDRIGSKIERDHAWSLLSKHANWWEPGALKPEMAIPSDEEVHIFYRISVGTLSGRAAST